MNVVAMVIVYCRYKHSESLHLIEKVLLHNEQLYLFLPALTDISPVLSRPYDSFFFSSMQFLIVFPGSSNT